MFGRTLDGLTSRFGWRDGLGVFVRLRLAKYLPSGSLVRVRVPGWPAPVHLRARTTDAIVLKQLLLERPLDFPLSAPARFIVDAGANVGLTSAFLATRFPEARIVALEIDASNFALLRRNLQAYANVIPLNAGLWSRATQLVVSNPESRSWAFRAEERASGSRDGVPGYGVADLMHQFGVSRVDVLKVDIEGGEREVFGPASEEWLDRVTCVAVELHDAFIPGCEEIVAKRLAGRFVRSRSGEYHVFTRSATGLLQAR